MNLKKILSIVISAAMVFSTFAVPAMADEIDNWVDVADTEWYGDGTATSYEVDTPAELAGLAKLVNEGNDFSGKTVNLTASIDLEQIEWTPIGDARYDANYALTDAANVFCGIFDGNGKTISNLKIEKNFNGGPDEDANIGLFSITGQGAVIKNLTITNVDINTDGRNVGAVAGVTYTATTLENITVNGDIQVKGGNNVSAVGGMSRYADVTAKNIKVSGNKESSIIEGNNIVGGIFAEIAPKGSDYTFSGLTVENVAINGVGGVGGIVGLLTNGTISTVSVKNVELVGKTTWKENEDRIRLGSIVGLLGSGSNSSSTVSNIVAIENVIAKNLEGEDVVLPVVGANYTGSVGNATEARIGDKYYATLMGAMNAAKDGDTMVLLADITLDKDISFDGTVVLDLNGNTITGTDKNASGSFGLISIQPGADLTINDTVGTGAITLKAETDRVWNAYSSVISNQRGKLTVNGGKIEHLGGTSMAYGIDNLTNGKDTYAETIINGGTIKSTYRAVRQFLNGVEAQNILTVNGGTVEGVNKSIWMQDPSANANTGTLTVGENAVLNGDVYLFVTEGSTEWPVTVSIAASAVNGKVLSANVPTGYGIANNGGTYAVVLNTNSLVKDTNLNDNITVSEGHYKSENRETAGIKWCTYTFIVSGEFNSVAVETVKDEKTFTQAKNQLANISGQAMFGVVATGVGSLDAINVTATNN